MRGKQERQNWWNNLSGSQQEICINNWQKVKRAKRLIKSQRIMRSSNLKYDCNQCFHSITDNCTHVINGGCIKYYDAKNEIFGPGYDKIQIAGKKTG